MSGGISCTCSECEKPVEERRWYVMARRYSYSAFNGYKRAPSDYSQIYCERCGVSWRSKAAYVSKLKGGDP